MNTMPVPLDPTIAAYIEASNAGNIDALTGCFTGDASKRRHSIVSIVVPLRQGEGPEQDRRKWCRHRPPAWPVP